ncbi:MAG: DMT family transporter [Gammaproteobacteria bacterium]
MFVRAAYIGVVLIWSTTPLAIQWSSESGDYLFAISLRMLIGLSVLYVIFSITQLKLSSARSAMQCYVTSGLGIIVSMTCVYWGAQFIPSGWIAVIFGLSPISTGLLSALFINEKNISSFKVAGMVMGLLGLIVIFGTSNQLNAQVLWGVFAVFVSTFTHSLSAVLIKRINAPISGVEASLGGLTVAVPILLLSLLFSGKAVPIDMPTYAWASILYLGVIATALGFTLYYYILKNLEAIRVSMITLITPVIALLLGGVLNNEPLTASILIGVALVVIGLAMFQFEKNIGYWLRQVLKIRPLMHK